MTREIQTSFKKLELAIRAMEKAPGKDEDRAVREQVQKQLAQVSGGVRAASSTHAEHAHEASQCCANRHMQPCLSALVVTRVAGKRHGCLNICEVELVSSLVADVLLQALFKLSVDFRKEETRFLQTMEEQKGIVKGSTLGILEEDEGTR